MNIIYNLMIGLGGLSCTAIGAFFLHEGKEGWGWFLFCAILLFLSLASTKVQVTLEDKEE